MKKEKMLNNIIEALSKHEDNSAVDVLERIGTNCEDDEVRRLTAQALINRNTPDALAIVISKPGKGINDLSTTVAMSAINDLLALQDKSVALNILNNAEQEENNDETIRETAKSVKSLMAFSSNE